MKRVFINASLSGKIWMQNIHLSDDEVIFFSKNKIQFNSMEASQVKWSEASTQEFIPIYIFIHAIKKIELV